MKKTAEKNFGEKVREGFECFLVFCSNYAKGGCSARYVLLGIGINSSIKQDELICKPEVYRCWRQSRKNLEVFYSSYSRLIFHSPLATVVEGAIFACSRDITAIFTYMKECSNKHLVP